MEAMKNKLNILLTSNPIVSILTTVYNRNKYLVACIDSVMASTYQDWKIIIVDDVSSDGYNIYIAWCLFHN